MTNKYILLKFKQLSSISF